MKVRVKLELKNRGGKQQIRTKRAEETKPWVAQKPLLVTLALTRAWQIAIDSGKYASITALAARLKLDYSYIARLMNLTLLDPQIITDIVNGTEPSGTSIEKLSRGTPYCWDQQRQKFGWPKRTAAVPDAEDIPAKHPVCTKPKDTETCNTVEQSPSAKASRQQKPKKQKPVNSKGTNKSPAKKPGKAPQVGLFDGLMPSHHADNQNKINGV